MTIRSFKDFTPKIDNTAYIDDSAVIIGDVEIGEQEIPIGEHYKKEVLACLKGA